MRQFFHIHQKMRKKISHHQYRPGDDWTNMVLNEKPTKNLKLRGLELRGLRQNQISTPIYQNGQHKNILAILRGKHQRGRAPPTQLKK